MGAPRATGGVFKAQHDHEISTCRRPAPSGKSRTGPAGNSSGGNGNAAREVRRQAAERGLGSQGPVEPEPGGLRPTQGRRLPPVVSAGPGVVNVAGESIPFDDPSGHARLLPGHRARRMGATTPRSRPTPSRALSGSVRVGNQTGVVTLTGLSATGAAAGTSASARSPGPRGRCRVFPCAASVPGSCGPPGRWCGATSDTAHHVTPLVVVGTARAVVPASLLEHSPNAAAGGHHASATTAVGFPSISIGSASRCHPARRPRQLKRGRNRQVASGRLQGADWNSRS